MAATNANVPGIIESTALYRAEEFCRRMGLGRRAYDLARRRGLPVIKFGKRVYLYGADVIEFMRRQNQSSIET